MPCCFNSSSPKTGCKVTAAGRRSWRSFNPHPARRPDARIRELRRLVGVPVSILIQPEDRMQVVGHQPAVVPVSILIQPEDRMGQRVSILIQPEDRMQEPLGHQTSSPTLPSFNPHPARRPDASQHLHVVRPHGHNGFNPHPARRPDARRCSDGKVFACLTFQSSSSPKTGCRSAGNSLRVLPQLRMFQSSSSPKTGCKSHFVNKVAARYGFNPHPARRPDASRTPAFATVAVAVPFQSSSSPKTGCKSGYCATVPRVRFQSSSSPKTGCKRVHR